MNLKQKLLAKLLHLANSSPPCPSEDFYDLKKKLLQKYATPQGSLIQQIGKECYGYYNPSWDDYDGCIGTDCLKCDGSGVFDTVYYRLNKWDWCGYSFLIPAGKAYFTAADRPEPDIVGRVEHQVKSHRMAREAHFWLYLLAGEWEMLGNEFDGSYHLKCRLWPMLNLQRAWAKIYRPYKELRRRIRGRHCFCCDKKYYREHGMHGHCKACSEKFEHIDPPF